jgi:hypothetical protein
MVQIMNDNKKETFKEWLTDNIIFYAIPVCITLCIVVTESWPYKPLHHFFNGHSSGKFTDSARDMIMTGIFLINAAVLYAIKYLFAKMK